jgi:hypothetical protein
VALADGGAQNEAALRVNLASGARTSTEDYLLRLLMNDAG